MSGPERGEAHSSLSLSEKSGDGEHLGPDHSSTGTRGGETGSGQKGGRNLQSLRPPPEGWDGHRKRQEPWEHEDEEGDWSDHLRVSQQR